MLNHTHRKLDQNIRPPRILPHKKPAFRTLRQLPLQIPQYAPYFRSIHPPRSRSRPVLYDSEIDIHHEALRSGEVCERHWAEDFVANPVPVSQAEFVRGIEGADEVGGDGGRFGDLAVSVAGAGDEEGGSPVRACFEEGGGRAEWSLGVVIWHAEVRDEVVFDA